MAVWVWNKKGCGAKIDWVHCEIMLWRKVDHVDTNTILIWRPVVWLDLTLFRVDRDLEAVNTLTYPNLATGRVTRVCIVVKLTVVF